ncbi:hypothetical protein J2X68_005051 [Streptomyces sp. 3330]|uniref:hypothetical protein n=1 Tax=Streptomyces sp. 3330 TaxID=2817755 RepID=UPI0028556220|nr:hypothetical protein [Streptomyces sp. 3330]MDR6978325.1 hypothetical protein [Streptomyces sp. 3330]
MTVPTEEDVLDVYSDFIQRFQSLALAHERSYPAAVHVRSARELLDSARHLMEVLDQQPRAVVRGPMPAAREIATALRIAVPSLLVHAGYATPPLPALHIVLTQLIQATHYLHQASRPHPRWRQPEFVEPHRGRLQDALSVLAEISGTLTGDRTAYPTVPPASRRSAVVQGVLRVSRRLLPFFTSATAVACAPLLLPEAGGVIGALASVGSSLAGILLPSADDLMEAFNDQPDPVTVPQTHLLTVAADQALQEAESYLPPPTDDSRQQWAHWACQAAEHHLDALLDEAGDIDLTTTLDTLRVRVNQVRDTLDFPPAGLRDIRTRLPTRRVRKKPEQELRPEAEPKPEPPEPPRPGSSEPDVRRPPEPGSPGATFL